MLSYTSFSHTLRVSLTFWISRALHYGVSHDHIVVLGC